MAKRSVPPSESTLNIGDRVRSTKVNAYLAISGLRGQKTSNQVLVPVSGINMSFSIGTDTLPTAQFSIPVGVALVPTKTTNEKNSRDKRTIDSKNFSNIQHILDDLTETTVIDLWVGLQGLDPNGNPWSNPDQFFLAWHGYYAGVGYGSTRGQMTINLSSIHWLMLLDNGSVISQDLVKGTFSDLLASSQMETTEGSGIVDMEGLAEIARSASGLRSGSTDVSRADIWKTMLLPILTALMSPDSIKGKNVSLLNKQTPWYKFLKTIKENVESKDCANTPAANKFIENFGRGLGNGRALSVLIGSGATGSLVQRDDSNWAYVLASDIAKAFTGTKSELREYFENYNLDGIAARDALTTLFGFDNASEINVGGLNVSGYNNVTVARNIAEEVARQCANLVGSQSAMDKIRTISSLFAFSIVPNVRSATVSPALPVFRKEDVWRVLTPSQYYQVDYPPSYPNTLSGIALTGNFQELQTIQKEPVDEEYKRIGEICGAFIGQETGRMLPLRAPFWLRYRGAANADYNRDDPDSNPAYDTTKRVKTKTDRDAFLKLSCDYARAMWYIESLKFKTMTVTMPLRFDIAPGSKIAVLGLKYTPDAAQGQNSNVLGFVTDVMINIDSNAGTAYTVIRLSHVRPIDGNTANEALVPQIHPLYFSGKLWSGTPLVRLKPNDLVKENFDSVFKATVS